MALKINPNSLSPIIDKMQAHVTRQITSALSWGCMGENGLREEDTPFC